MSEPVIRMDNNKPTAIPDGWYRLDARNDRIKPNDKIFDDILDEWMAAPLDLIGHPPGGYEAIREGVQPPPVPTMNKEQGIPPGPYYPTEPFDWNAAATDFIVMGFAAAEADPSETWFDEKALEAAQPRVQAKVATVISVLQAWLAKHKPPTV